MKRPIPPVFTNVRIFGAIAETAFTRMSEDMAKNIRPASGGGSGTIKTYDPEQKSLKDALICIVFSCIWLEALLHLLIVRQFGRKCFKKVDRWPYGKKLELLGCTNVELLKQVGQLRESRKEIVHEKAYFEFTADGEFKGEVKAAQDEAENARTVMSGVRDWCREHFEIDPL